MENQIKVKPFGKYISVLCGHQNYLFERLSLHPLFTLCPVNVVERYLVRRAVFVAELAEQHVFTLRRNYASAQVDKHVAS